MKCPICAQEIREDVNFCGKCGSRIPRCPTCGMALYQRVRFCLNDGTRLPEDVLSLLPAQEPVSAAPLNVAEIAASVLGGGSVPDRENTQPMQAPKTDPEQPAAGRPKPRFCLECGRPCVEGERLCSDCKAKLDRQDRPVPPAAGPAEGRRREEAPSRQRKEKKGGAMVLLIVLVILLLLLALGFAGYVAYSNGLIGPQSGASERTDRTDETEETDKDPDGEADDRNEPEDRTGGEDGGAEQPLDDAAVPADAPVAEPADPPGEELQQTPEEPAQQAPVEPEQPEQTPDQQPVEVVHTYEIVRADVTWMEARDACIARGGHLATITSQEEYEQICALADGQGLKYLWLGACLKSDDDSWGNSNWITGEDWTFDNWYPGEPSLMDTGDGTREYFLCMWYAKYNGNDIGWTFNDQRNDIIEVLPSIKGTVGYVCEYENEAAQ